MIWWKVKSSATRGVESWWDVPFIPSPSSHKQYVMCRKPYSHSFSLLCQQILLENTPNMHRKISEWSNATVPFPWMYSLEPELNKVSVNIITKY
jgi:hypothetical protein